MSASCEHYRDTGKPHDFRFPCAFPRCPEGVSGFELHVPSETAPKYDWVVENGKWVLRMLPLAVKVFERWRFDKGGQFFWKERQPA